MALNVPTTKTKTCNLGHVHEAEPWEIDDIVDYRLDWLIGDLEKEGVKIDKKDIHYEFLSRSEDLYIKADKIYPNDGVDIRFGCGRGYNGGGIHSGLGSTDVNWLPARRQAKAKRLLELFKKHFWGVLEDIDKNSAGNEGVEELEAWDKVSLKPAGRFLREPDKRLKTMKIYTKINKHNILEYF